MLKQPTRHCLRWNINEVLRLQREYELLEMCVSDIAKLHNRSVNSIINKLVSEKMVENYGDARGYSFPSSNDDVLDNDSDSDDGDDDKDEDYIYEEDDNEEGDEDEDEEEDEEEDEVKALNKRLQRRICQLEGIIAEMKTESSSSRRRSPRITCSK